MKKTKPDPKKLELSRITLKELTTADLAQAVGGALQKDTPYLSRCCV